MVRNIELLDTITQSNTEEAGELLRAQLRAIARDALCELMHQEVEELCGKRYERRQEEPFSRAGSAPGFCRINDEVEQITRPRVRLREGKEEVALKTYEAGQDASNIEKQIMLEFLNGISTRGQQRVHPDSLRGRSKSHISRIWAREASLRLDELEKRDLSKDIWVALMLDGIVLSNDIVVTVGIGITSSGCKKILGFKVGGSENYEVCNDLLTDITARGFKVKGRLLAILDGSAALKKAVLSRYRGAVIQRCLVHKERNLKGYLSHRDYPELSRLFKRLRLVQGEKDAREILLELTKFISSRNSQAQESLKEAGEELIALHLLNVPSTLNKSLLSTNSIENCFKNVRRFIGRVGRWRKKGNQAELWVASGLLMAEEGFHKIKGHHDIGELQKALQWPAKGTKQSK